MKVISVLATLFLGVFSVVVEEEMMEGAPNPWNNFETVTFNYNESGANWGDTAAWSECSSGTLQSPISLSKSNSTIYTSANSTNLGYSLHNYQDYDQTIAFNNKAAVITVSKNGTFTTNTTTNMVTSGQQVSYGAEFIFHAPAEHIIDGVQYPVEMQILQTNQDQTGALGVISIMFYIDDDKPANPLIESIPFSTVSDQAPGTNATNVNLNQFLRWVDWKSYYQYKGSLSVPPCNQGILWTVIANPMPINTSQVDELNALYKNDYLFGQGNGNNRLIQNSNSRAVNYVTLGSVTLLTSLATMAASAFLSL